MLLFGIISAHIVGFQIGPKMTNTLLCCVFVYFRLILSDFKLGQTWLIGAHLLFGKHILPTYSKTTENSVFCLKYIMLLCDLVSSHTTRFEIRPTMAERQPMYSFIPKRY